MRLVCKNCNTIVIRTVPSLKEEAARRGIPYDDLVSNFLCRKCKKTDTKAASKEEAKSEEQLSDQSNTDQPADIQPDIVSGEKMYMALLCRKCARSCKIYTISQAAILECPKYERRKDS